MFLPRISSGIAVPENGNAFFPFSSPLRSFLFSGEDRGARRGGATGWILREKKMENSFLQKKVESAPAGGEWGAERGFF